MPDLIAITPEITHLYQEVRLRALQDAPFAFGSTYAKEAQFTDEVWRQRASNLDGQNKIGFLVSESGKPCGLVCCFRDEHVPSKADVVSMWVAAAHRGTGLSTMLMDAIRIWAISRGVDQLHLMVTSNNDPAIKFYERYGFSKSGHTEPYPNDPALFEFEMILQLQTA